MKWISLNLNKPKYKLLKWYLSDSMLDKIKHDLSKRKYVP